MRTPEKLIVFGRAPLRVEDVVALARGQARPALEDAPAFRARLEASRASLERQLAAGRVVYGVTTGVGESCETAVDAPWALALATNLQRFHGCGTGAALSDEEAAAVVAARLGSLACGLSGVRPVVLEALVALLRQRVLPVIPSEGSVGASGDLTPLSYVAAVVMGEREATWEGVVRPAAEALAAAGLTPLALLPKESLALMNGTSMMTGLACLVFARAQQLARLACWLTAGACHALAGNPSHFDARLFAAKPHPGQAAAASWIRADLGVEAHPPAGPHRLQDRYSLRCAPHVIGVLLDALAAFRPWIEIELNGANDNPLVDATHDEVLHGGNFYGGHMAFAMDGLKTAVANVADLMDRQLALLCNPATSHGLPADLVAHPGPGSPAHHGFKAMQISASALTAEALKLCVPASIFSRSTESHNQDKVSMGSIAARDAQRVLELSETVAAIGVLAVAQGLELRAAQDGGGTRGRALDELVEALRKEIPANRADRRQDLDIQHVLARYRRQGWPLGSASFA